MMEYLCRKCGFKNINRLFCQRCASSLRYQTDYDLKLEDFVTDGDKQALLILKAMGPLLNLLYSVAVEPRLKNLTARLTKITQSQRFESLAEETAEILSLDYLPSVYEGNFDQPNALTTGTDSDATIIIDKEIVNHLSDDELKALLGHEMGHIKSHHLLYHSIAELLERGISFSGSLAGLKLLSIPLRLALLAWHRESEFSADRAGIIAAGEFTPAVSMLAKITGNVNQHFNLNSDISTLLESFQSHPQYLDRFNALKKFANSSSHLEAKKKIEYRKKYRQAFNNICKYCRAAKPIEELFCPTCQRALA